MLGSLHELHGDSEEDTQLHGNRPTLVGFPEQKEGEPGSPAYCCSMEDGRVYCCRESPNGHLAYRFSSLGEGGKRWKTAVFGLGDNRGIMRVGSCERCGLEGSRDLSPCQFCGDERG